MTSKSLSRNQPFLFSKSISRSVSRHQVLTCLRDLARKCGKHLTESHVVL